jgi:hypothetical protein
MSGHLGTYSRNSGFRVADINIKASIVQKRNVKLNVIGLEAMTDRGTNFMED